ncbi:hypothetical protein ANCCEY_14477 [Ancylostoma ceylanicum]|uniref:Uncharacterized protein n=1 Tax=Ancylostoma ceylanicum TaxID=53326 RepID=A0A0D6L524_9BILA|nr:hypothetical protein ANCCEY_14477 [Ancylostoma ceylanicum]
MSEEAIDRLEGRIDTFGGLVIRKTKSDTEKKSHEEGRSVLGLDRLARVKKEEHLRKRGDETPGAGAPFTPSRYSWNDDDGPVQKSSWDTPSPRTVSSSRRGDSERSVSSIWRSERRHREEDRKKKYDHIEESVRSMKEEGFE